MSEKIYEMAWDCTFCGTKKLLGKTHRHCPQCGAAQDPSARYFPAEEDKVAVEDHEYVGADKACGACSTPNSAKAAHCVNCGGPLEGEVARVGGGKGVGVGVARPDEGSTAPAPPPPPPAKSNRLKYLVIGAIALVVVAVAVLVLWKKPTSVTADGRSWSRTLHVEKFQKTRDGAWCDSKPSDAYSITRKKKQRSTNKVPDGQTCTTKNVDRGDGTFKQVEECKPKYREEPVYDQWCDYTVDRWGTGRSVSSEGKGATPAPSWPDVKVDACQHLGCERIGKKKETYTARMLGEDGDAEECNVPRARWERMNKGSAWIGKRRVLTGGLDCDTLAQAQAEAEP